jgi:hypothetical protein
VIVHHAADRILIMGMLTGSREYPDRDRAHRAKQ